MANITASMVKELREKSGAGMMDCKKALTENDGDIEAAMDWLRTKGIASAEKKSGRTAAQGLVGLKTDQKKGVLIELNAETDFVSRNEHFQNFLRDLTDLAIETGTESLAEQDFNGKPVKDALTDLIAKIGENMNLRRADSLEVDNGVIASYVHNAEEEGLGQIGVIVALESKTNDTEKLEELGRKIAMHVAAAKPESLDIDSLDAEIIERERTVLVEQARESGKPDNIIEKMVEGRMRKFYEEAVLLEQTYVIDNESKVSDVIAQKAEELGNPIKLTGFIRFELGEGIEVEQEDFAQEVASAIAS